MSNQEQDSDLLERYGLSSSLDFHQGDVCTISVLHNGHIASGGGDNTVYIFDGEKIISSMKGIINLKVNCPI